VKPRTFRREQITCTATVGLAILSISVVGVTPVSEPRGDGGGGMWWTTAIWLVVVIVCSTTFGWAGPADDCNDIADDDLVIRGCTELIKAGKDRSSAYIKRGRAYARKDDFDRGIVDYTKAIEINPKDIDAYQNRGISYYHKNDYDRAIVDHTKAIGINSKDVDAYTLRGGSYLAKGDYDRAIVDFTKAIEISPKAYVNRGTAYEKKGDYDRAMADYTKAIEINQDSYSYLVRGGAYQSKGELDRAISDFNKAREIDPNAAHLYLGRAHLRQGDVDQAISDLSEAIRLQPKDPEPLVERGAAYEAKGQIERAILDYRVALALPARFNSERQAHDEARRRLAAIESRKQPTEPKPVTTSALPTATPTGRRVALVIGNANYVNASQLHNPTNDGRAVAATFRRLGFAEVIERYDLGQVPMIHALKEFGDKAVLSDWAVVFYSGHGMEMNGIAYLIPVDAKLERDTHVDDEAVPLQRVLDKVSSAQKLRLVILDACRNNPFVTRMVRSGGATRSIGRGLAPVEPEGGVLVAYAAKHGTTAEDGTGTNSPFTEALVASLEEPGLEIGFLFRKVRDKVLTTTARRQEPYLYGSLPNEGLYFRP
jgi:tetratricopeptide (TPR) repeat protein